MNDRPSILIVDDDSSARRTLRLIFEKKGYTVETVGRGQDAREKAQERAFNVALLDLKLPDVEGVDLLASLSEIRPEMALMMITGHASVDTAVQALNEGASAYITKPFDVDEVLAKVDDILEKQRLIREKRQAEEALRRSEERYRSLFEGVPVGLYRTTPEGEIVDANPALAQMLGYPNRESLLEVYAGDFFVKPEDREREIRLLERDGIVRGFETQMRRKDGQIIWTRNTVRVVQDAEGRVQYYEGSLEDITERKSIEEERQKYVRELQIINDTVVAASRMQDVDEICQLVAETVHEINPGAYVVVSLHDRKKEAIRIRAMAGFGETVDRVLSLLGADPREMYFHPDQMGEEVELYKTGRLERIPGGIYQLLTERLPRAAGGAVERLLGVDAVYNVGFALEGEPYGGIILLTPSGQSVRHGPAIETLTSHVSLIMQRRQAEEALRESERKYRSFFKASMDCIFITSKDGRWIDMNEAAIELFGYRSREELQAVKVEYLFENPSERAAHLRTIEEQGYTKEHPVNLRRRDGSVINALITSVPIRDEDGTVTGFMGTIRDVTEWKRAREALRQRVAQLGLLNDIGERIASVLDLEAVLDRAVRLVQANFGYHHVAVFTLNNERDELIMRARAGDFAHLFPPDHRLQMREGLVGWVGYSGKRQLANDVDTDPHYVNLYPDQIPTRSELAVPITVSGEVVGVLDVQSPRLNAFDENDVLTMETLANQVAVAIENARLYEQTNAQAKEASRLLRIANAIKSTLEPSQVLQELAWGAAWACEAHRCTIVLLGERGESLVPLTSQFASGRMDPEMWELFKEKAAPRSVKRVPEAMEVIREHRPLLIPNVDESSFRSWVEPFDMGSALLVPLVNRERAIGVMVLDNPEIGRTFTDAQVNLAMTVSAQAVTAIENSRLFQTERRQRQLTEALEEAAAVVSSTLELDLVLDRILEQVERVVAGDAFNVMLIEEENARVARWRGYDPPRILGFSGPISHYPSLVKMVKSEEPVVVPDTAANPDWVQKGWQEGWRSYVAAPIQVAGLTVGFLNVMSGRSGQFGPADARCLEAFGRHAAIAIENAQLYRELRNYAEGLEERVQERTAQIQTQYARLEAILASTADGIVVTDGDGEILQANPVARAWLTQTLPPDETDKLEGAIRDLALQAEERPEAVLELGSLDLQLNVAPVSESPGGERTVVAIHDISHLKELDRLKSRFVSNVSHELRTPITTIQLYASLMDKQPERWREYLEPLAKEAKRQGELVEAILEISRIDAKRLELDTESKRINELTETVVDNHRLLAQGQGVSLEYHPTEPGPVALVDPERMMQALNNLVENAINYTLEGGEVQVSTGTREAEGRIWVTTTVTDTGIGIPEEELPHIFERFFRGEEPQAEQMPGTGLGLAIVKEVVELHGGWVTVESEVGAGSTFTVWLPPGN